MSSDDPETAPAAAGSPAVARPGGSPTGTLDPDVGRLVEIREELVRLSQAYRDPDAPFEPGRRVFGRVPPDIVATLFSSLARLKELLSIETDGPLWGDLMLKGTNLFFRLRVCRAFEPGSLLQRHVNDVADRLSAPPEGASWRRAFWIVVAAAMNYERRRIDELIPPDAPVLRKHTHALLESFRILGEIEEREGTSSYSSYLRSWCLVRALRTLEINAIETPPGREVLSALRHPLVQAAESLVRRPIPSSADGLGFEPDPHRRDLATRLLFLGHEWVRDSSGRSGSGRSWSDILTGSPWPQELARQWLPASRGLDPLIRHYHIERESLAHFLQALSEVQDPLVPESTRAEWKQAAEALLADG